MKPALINVEHNKQTNKDDSTPSNCLAQQRQYVFSQHYLQT